ncbi:CopC domain-containing protein YobA [Pseudocitrobacter cyperus]|uniref:Copper resistance protein C n=1 Tax=Pseudocitrobacter cyperus TaxID=3112843 RepID=A0ABV0HE55_9ENTR
MGNMSARAFSAMLFLTCSLSAPGVWAHAHLQQQTPAADSEITATPQSLTLNFSEGVESRFSAITVTDPEGKTVDTGKVVRSETNKAELSIPFNQPLSAGVYTVKWHVVSVDGHKTQGHYQFRVK